MDHVEMYNTDENKSSKIRKKSAFLPDGSYRIFYMTKKGKEDGDDDDDHQNNIDQIIDKKSSKVKDQNGLEQFLFLHKPTCELPLHDQTNELSQSVIKLSEENQLNIKREPKDETIVHNHVPVRTDRFEPTSRKQVVINMQPASFQRRRKRFIVACGTVLVALTVIITIIIYTIIMTINHRIQMSQSSFRNHPR